MAAPNVSPPPRPGNIGSHLSPVGVPPAGPFDEPAVFLDGLTLSELESLTPARVLALADSPLDPTPYNLIFADSVLAEAKRSARRAGGVTSPGEIARELRAWRRDCVQRLGELTARLDGILREIHALDKAMADRRGRAPVPLALHRAVNRERADLVRRQREVEQRIGRWKTFAAEVTDHLQDLEAEDARQGGRIQEEAE